MSEQPLDSEQSVTKAIVDLVADIQERGQDDLYDEWISELMAIRYRAAKLEAEAALVSLAFVVASMHTATITNYEKSDITYREEWLKEARYIQQAREAERGEADDHH